MQATQAGRRSKPAKLNVFWFYTLTSVCMRALPVRHYWSQTNRRGVALILLLSIVKYRTYLYYVSKFITRWQNFITTNVRQLKLPICWLCRISKCGVCRLHDTNVRSVPFNHWPRTADLRNVQWVSMRMLTEPIPNHKPNPDPNLNLIRNPRYLFLFPWTGVWLWLG